MQLRIVLCEVKLGGQETELRRASTEVNGADFVAACIAVKDIAGDDLRNDPVAWTAVRVARSSFRVNAQVVSMLYDSVGHPLPSGWPDGGISRINAHLKHVEVAAGVKLHRFIISTTDTE